MYIIVHINDKNIYQNTCIHRQNFTQIYIKDHVSIDKVLKYISKYIDPYTKCGWSCHLKMSHDASYDNYTILGY